MGVPSKRRCERFEVCGQDCPITALPSAELQRDATVSLEFAIENRGEWPDGYPGPRNESAFLAARACLGKMCTDLTYAIRKYEGI